MLVVTRKLWESVVIGEVTVTVVPSQGAGVRLAIDAPRDVPILRAEIAERAAADGGRRVEAGGSSR